MDHEDLPLRVAEMPSFTSIRVRVATVDDAQGIARVQVDTWRSTYRGIVPDSYLDSLTYEARSQQWARMLAQDDGTFAFVAEHASGIVAFASGGPNRGSDLPFAGALYAIYVSAGQQGRGQGCVLFHQVARQLVSASLPSMVVWVFAQNPACGFYERMGGKPCAETTFEIGGKNLSKVAYGWPNIGVLG
jgi:hypothetical protein